MILCDLEWFTYFLQVVESLFELFMVPFLFITLYDFIDFDIFCSVSSSIFYELKISFFELIFNSSLSTFSEKLD